MKLTPFLALPFLLVALSGCPADTEKTNDATSPVKQATSRPSITAPPSPQDDWVDSGQYPGRVHLVEPKDTLLHLAEKYYGDRNQWRRIWQANKKRLPNPNDLPVGMKLIIP